MSIYSYNVKYLEHLIKEKIDSVRIAHQLQPLYNDTILYKAAKFHATYLFDLGDLNHYEPQNKVMETPQKRVDHYGAVNYLVGENIAFTLVGKPVKGKKTAVHTNMTYNQTANDLTIAWVNSPGHYKNIITPDYNATGLAVWTDEQKGRVYAVQNFAQILFKYDFTEDKQFFSYSNYVSSIKQVSSFEGIDNRLHKGKHVHKLKTPKHMHDCDRCSDTSFHFVDYSKIDYRNGNVYFTCFDLNWIYQLLAHKKDGFAVELVAYNPYDCGNPAYYTEPSRRNGQCVFSGKVLKPVYKKKAIKGFKAGADRKKILKKLQEGKLDKYEVKLGKIPKKYLVNHLELNLVVLQNKRVCRIVKFSDYEADTLRPAYKTPIILLPLDTSLRFHHFNSKASFKIPFLKGKAEYNVSDLKPFTDSLLSTNFTIDSLAIEAYASVEGSQAVNEKLLQARAAQIQKALSTTNAANFMTSVESAENWVLFERQTKEQTALKDYRGLAPEQVKAKLEDSLQQKRLEPFLQQQRSMQLQLWAKVQVDANNCTAFLTKKLAAQKQALDSLLKLPEFNRERLFKHTDTLLRCLNTAAHFVLQQQVSSKIFNDFKLRKHPALLNYELLRLNTLAHALPNMIDSVPQALQFYSELAELYNQGQTSFFVVYNMISILQRHQLRMKTKVSDEMQSQLIEQLQKLGNDSVSIANANKLALNFWFSMCDKAWENVPKEKRALYESSLKSIHQYYQNRVLTKEEDNRLARFYCFHSQFKWAYDVLIKYYDKKIDNAEGLIILSKILYLDYQLDKSDDYNQYLQSVYERLGKERWCPMFIGKHNISFQVLDNDNFRRFYCEKCGDYLNEAKRPEN